MHDTTVATIALLIAMAMGVGDGSVPGLHEGYAPTSSLAAAASTVGASRTKLPVTPSPQKSCNKFGTGCWKLYPTKTCYAGPREFGEVHNGGFFLYNYYMHRTRVVSGKRVRINYYSVAIPNYFFGPVTVGSVYRYCAP